MTRAFVRYGAPFVAMAASAACRADAQQPATHTPMADLTGLGAAVEHDTTSMVGAARLAALPLAERARWTAYVARSREDRARDTALIVRELARVGRAQWTTPRVVKDFRITERMTPAWFRSDSARHIGLTMLSFQTPSGGWSKHVDMFGPPRAPGESFFSESSAWEYIPTIDNGATTQQLEFLARLNAAQPDARWRDSFTRGVRYLLRAQYPSGGFPQVYPLQGGYHDATTYNDDATVLALRVLQDVATGRHAFVPASMRREAAAAVTRGVDGILADQVTVGGQRTVWGQQHDPLTHAPVGARSYELAGLTGGESCGVLDFLMDLSGSYPGVVPVGAGRHDVAPGARGAGCALRLAHGHVRPRLRRTAHVGADLCAAVAAPRHGKPGRHPALRLYGADGPANWVRVVSPRRGGDTPALRRVGAEYGGSCRGRPSAPAVRDARG